MAACIVVKFPARFDGSTKMVREARRLNTAEDVSAPSTLFISVRTHTVKI